MGGALAAILKSPDLFLFAAKAPPTENFGIREFIGIASINLTYSSNLILQINTKPLSRLCYGQKRIN